MQCNVLVADYHNPDHATCLADLLDAYARDPMGGGKPLEPEVKARVVNELAKRPYAFTVLAFIAGRAVGFATCFEGFSTFAAKPLINIHDVAVLPAFRGQGISSKLLTKIEEIAVARDCCKLTLEVLEGNHTAQAAYKKMGFAGYELDPAMGQAVFWQKNLSNQ